MSHLLPDGIRSLRDAPYTLQRAIKTGLIFLSFEDLPPEDIPPRNIWLDGEALKEHFDDIRRKHKERMSGKEIDDPRRNAAVDMLIVGDR